MRTRTSGLGATEGVRQPQLNAARKRDSGVYLCDDDDVEEMEATTREKADNMREKPLKTPKTPSSKRVRFSDPGLLPTPDATPRSRTGLTPSMQRARVDSPTSRRVSSPQVRRRASLPSGPATPTSQSPAKSITITPYRQVLEERVRRRLRRAHLSEDFGRADADVRASEAALRQLAGLRAESAQKEARIRELTFELESQRQLGILVNAEEEARLEGLRAELARLREAVNAKQSAVTSFQAASPSPTETDYGTEVDFGFEPFAVEGSSVVVASPCLDLGAFTPPADVAAAHNLVQPSAGFKSGRGGDAEECRLDELTRDGFSAVPISPPTSPTPDLNRRLETLTNQLNEQARSASDAYAALSIIHSELHALGIVPSSEADIDQILTFMHESFRRARIELEGLVPGETPGGFDNGKLLKMMLAHIRKLVNKVEDQERATFQHSESERALRGNFNAALAKISDLEARKLELKASIERKDELIRDLRLAGSARKALLRNLEHQFAEAKAELADLQSTSETSNIHSSKQTKDLQAENQALEVSARKLSSTLDSYRAEVKNLEGVVIQLDEEKREMARTFVLEIKKVIDTQGQGLQILESEKIRIGGVLQKIVREADLDSANGDVETSVCEQVAL